MRINFDRLSQLAGISAGGNNRKGLNEGKGHEQDEGAYESYDAMDELSDELPESAFSASELSEDEEVDMEEMLDIDETMLVQELRRAKKIMNENKRRRLSESRRNAQFNNDLKQVIDEEVQNVLREMDIGGQWVYGNNRPTRSQKGYTHQGSFLPGFGFKR